MTVFRLGLAWIGMLLLLLLEVGSAQWLGWSGVAPWIGLVMAGVVAFAFMHLHDATDLMKIFVVAGLFWVMVLFGLGSLDKLTRSEVPVSSHSMAE